MAPVYLKDKEMPTITTYVAPELFKVIGGYKVYHTYKNNDREQGARTYAFTLNAHSDEEDFDVRVLEVPAVKLLDNHPPFKVNSDPAWANATAEERAIISQQWKVWQATGEEDAIAKVIEEAMAAGLLLLDNAELASSANDCQSKTTGLIVNLTEIDSNVKWATSPDMVTVSVSAEFLQKVEDCVSFMEDNGINYMVRWWAFDWTLYQLCDDPDTQNKPTIIGADGQRYVECEPEYRLDGCHATIYRDGEIQAVMPLKHTDEKLWSKVGNLKDLQFKLKSEPAQAVL